MKSHLDKLIRLLEIEQEAEARERRNDSSCPAPADGESLDHLVVVDRDIGLAGQPVLVLGLRDSRHALPWHRIAPGAPVVVVPRQEDGVEPARGVVCAVTEHAVHVVFSRLPDFPERDGTLRLELLPDVVSRERQRAALCESLTLKHGRPAQLRDILLGDRPPTEPSAVAMPDRWHASLNASQQEAVAFALAAPDIAIIHGPPGTGKTTTVVEVIAQAAARGERVMACAPSNLAVDLLVERLAAMDLRVVRIGHPARVSPSVLAHTLDQLLLEQPELKIARRLVRDATTLRADASRFTRARRTSDDRRRLRDEARGLIADAKRLEEQLIAYLLDSAQVVCATLTGIDRQWLGERRFALGVIDEAAQATEPACWIPVLRCDRIVLAGDHCQLPPTIRSSEAAREGLAVSLMERLMQGEGAKLARRLDTQYRMHASIMSFSSREFYDDGLHAAPQVSGHLLRDLPAVTEQRSTCEPLRFIDTAGAGYEEQQTPGDASLFNSGEAELAARHASHWREAGVAPVDIAVITPYAAQVRLLRDLLRDTGIEVDTVDGFQGREKEAVVVSLVRSNERGEIGFLEDIRRTNVALTRARRALTVIGDSATIGRHPFYARLLEYFEAQGAYHSVWEE